MGDGKIGLGARLLAPLRRGSKAKEAPGEEGNTTQVSTNTETSDATGAGSKSVIGRALSSLYSGTGSILSKLSPSTKTAFQKDLERIQRDEWTSQIDFDDVSRALIADKNQSLSVNQETTHNRNDAFHTRDHKEEFLSSLARSVTSLKREVDALDISSLEDLPKLQADADSLKLLAASKSLVETLEQANPSQRYSNNNSIDAFYIEQRGAFVFPGLDPTRLESIKRDLHTIADAHSKLGPKSFIKPEQTPLLAEVVKDLQLVAHGRITQSLYQELIAETQST
jgi:hypothetical protein